MMWQLALHMEEGQTEQSARSLEEARQAARDAMDKAQQQPNEQTRQELAKKLEELRQAIDRHMQALMEEAQRNNNIMPFDPKAMQLSDRDMQRMAEQAEQAAKEGRMADAQQQMARTGADARSAAQRADPGQRQQAGQQQAPARQAPAERGAGSDRAGGRLAGSRAAARQRRLRRPSDPAAQREADSRVQQALRRALGELMQQFTDLTGEASPGLGEADQAMRDAATQLNQGARSGGRPVAAAGDRRAAERQPGDGPGDGQDGPATAGPGRGGRGQAIRTVARAPWA